MTDGNPNTHGRQYNRDNPPLAQFRNAGPASGTWRAPTEEELAAIHDRSADHDAADTIRYVAVIDGYSDDSPGYVGRLALVVHGFPLTVTPHQLDGAEILEADA